jgi:hypothetical protein
MHRKMHIITDRTIRAHFISSSVSGPLPSPDVTASSGQGSSIGSIVVVCVFGQDSRTKAAGKEGIKETRTDDYTGCQDGPLFSSCSAIPALLLLLLQLMLL